MNYESKCSMMGRLGGGGGGIEIKAVHAFHYIMCGQIKAMRYEVP